MVREGKSFIRFLVNERQVQCTSSCRQLSQPLSVHLVLSSTPLKRSSQKKNKKKKIQEHTPWMQFVFFSCEMSSGACRGERGTAQGVRRRGRRAGRCGEGHGLGSWYPKWENTLGSEAFWKTVPPCWRLWASVPLDWKHFSGAGLRLDFSDDSRVFSGWVNWISLFC